MKVLVRNFRGIRNIEIDVVNGITILIGRNDSGKSSLIEAVYLGLTAFNGFKGGFVEYFSPAYLLMRRNTRISSLIFHGEKLAEISIVLDGQKYTIKISKDIDALRLDPQTRGEISKKLDEISSKAVETMRGYNALINFFASIFQAAIVTEVERAYPIYKPHGFSEIPPKVKKIFGVFESNGDVYSHFILYTVDMYPMITISTRKIPKMRIDAIFMDFASRRPIEEINRFLSEIIKRGLKEKIIRHLRLGNEQIVSIDLVMEDGQIIPLVQYSWAKSGIPLELSGDGIKTLLAVELASNVLSNHFVLLEEPENHMHPRLIDVLANSITEMAEKGVKYVIATHSIELIRSILSKIKDKDVDTVIYYLERDSQGSIKVTPYRKDIAIKKVVDLEFDLRR